MDPFQEAHFFSMPSQGNIYTYVNLFLADGTLKALRALLNHRVFCCELVCDDTGKLIPVVNEVSFAHIPDGAEIIAMDAFNRSTERDEFFVAITIIKDKGDGNKDAFLNIYSEPESESSGVLNIEALAQNCVIIDLTFTPYHLIHTFSVNNELHKETVFLLAGNDERIHLYSEDPMNHVFCEAQIESAFPELAGSHGIVLWIEMKYMDNFKSRLTALATKCGTVRLLLANSLTGKVMRRCSENFHGPISRVLMFKTNSHYDEIDEAVKKSVDLIPESRRKREKKRYDPLNLLVANTTESSFVFMNIYYWGLDNSRELPGSNSCDAVLSACACDINCDKLVELVLGTFSSVILLYRFRDEEWHLMAKDRMSHSVHSISYEDITGDGLKELIVATSAGIHVFQHRTQDVIPMFEHRFEMLKRRYLMLPKS